MSQLELIEPCADWDEYLLSDVARTTSGGTPDRSKKIFITAQFRGSNRANSTTIFLIAQKNTSAKKV
jgi:hypothetical protein